MKAKRYETRESFIRDVSVLVQNSEQYNGPNSVLTDTAKKMLDLCLQTIAEVSGPPELSHSKLIMFRMMLALLLSDLVVVILSVYAMCVTSERGASDEVREGDQPAARRRRRRLVRLHPQHDRRRTAQESRARESPPPPRMRANKTLESLRVWFWPQAYVFMSCCVGRHTYS